MELSFTNPWLKHTRDFQSLLNSPLTTQTFCKIKCHNNRGGKSDFSTWISDAIFRYKTHFGGFSPRSFQPNTFLERRNFKIERKDCDQTHFSLQKIGFPQNQITAALSRAQPVATPEPLHALGSMGAEGRGCRCPASGCAALLHPCPGVPFPPAAYSQSPPDTLRCVLCPS